MAMDAFGMKRLQGISSARNVWFSSKTSCRRFGTTSKCLERTGGKYRCRAMQEVSSGRQHSRCNRMIIIITGYWTELIHYQI